MKALWITLASLAGLLLLTVLLLLLGRVKIRFLCREKIQVVLSVFGIRRTLYDDGEEDEKKDLTSCRNPERVLKRELKRQKRAAAKAARKKRKAARKKQAEAAAGPQPNLNLPEKLGVLFTLIKAAYRKTRGKVRIRACRMHLKIGTEDAAKTAILYGVVLQTVACFLEWVEERYNPILRKPGEMEITPDYLSGKCSADVNIALSVSLWNGIVIALGLLNTHSTAKSKASRHAKVREARKCRKAA